MTDVCIKTLQEVDTVIGRQETFDHPIRVLRAANLSHLSHQVR